MREQGASPRKIEGIELLGHLSDRMVQVGAVQMLMNVTLREFTF